MKEVSLNIDESLSKSGKDGNSGASSKDRVTIYEVAHASNVSLATVSRVINNRPNVTEKTRKIVNDTIARLNYRPSALAQGLAKNKSTNVGIVIPSANYTYINSMLSGMVDIAKIYGYLTVLFITKPLEEDNQRMTEKLVASHVDGAVIYDDKLDEKSMDLIQSCNIPVIIIGKGIPSRPEIPHIILDFKTSLLSVYDKLFSQGNVDGVHYVTYEHQGPILQDLVDSTRKHCLVKNKKFDIINVDDNYNSAYDYFMEYFKTNKKGFFVVPRDSFGVSIINAAKDSNLSVPDDIQILSIIGSRYSTMARPMISTLSIDMFEVGSIAMRMLTKLLDETLKENSYLLQADYIRRGTTKE